MEQPSEPLMDALFASQSTSESQRILVHPDGRGYNIHLQVNGISLRPNLVRMMRKAGAHPSRPEDADIILVDSSQLDGKRLIRTWHQTPGKAILECRWLRKSVEAGKPLLEADAWAGEQAMDDGEPIVTIDDIVADHEEAEVEQIVSKSPLPTPRITPDESFAKHNLNNVPAVLAADPPLIPNDPMPHQPPQQSLLVNVLQQQPSEHAGQSVYNHASSISPPLQPSNTPQPVPLPPQFIPALRHNPQAPAQTQFPQPATPAPFPHAPFSQAPQFSQPQFSQAAQFPQQFPIPQQPYQFGQFPPQQFPPGQMPFMPQSTMMLTGMPFNNLDQQSFSMLTTFMDVMRNRNGGEFLQAGQPSPMHAHLEQSSSAPSPIHREQIPDSISVLDQPYSPPSSYKSHAGTPEAVMSKRPEKKLRPSARKLPANPFSRSPSVVLLPPSVRRKANHDAVPPVVKTPGGLPNKRSRKGKDRAVTPGESDSDEYDHPAGSDNILDRSPSSSSGHMKAIVARKNPGEVFLDDQGRPLLFFVQVDLQGRSGVVSNIKKNKGKVIGSIADADYVILFTRSQTFQGLLSEAQACDKIPLQSAFVTDCVAENVLLDETSYALDTGVSIKSRRGRQGVFFDLVPAEVPLSVKKEKPVSDMKPKPKAKKAVPAETPTKKVTKRLAPTSSKISAAPSSKDVKSARARRSPTPPPPETRKSMKDGKFYFTDPELLYFCRYAQFLLNEDPTMSTAALLQAVHKKMPHHSAASWQVQVSSKLKTQLTDIRKRANIAFRKSMAANAEKPNGEERPGPSKKPRLAALPTQEALEREDFEVICQFFASGGGDDDNDERVWELLQQHRSCKSAKSWPDYYTAHQSKVYAYIEELVRSSS